MSATEDLILLLLYTGLWLGVLSLGAALDWGLTALKRKRHHFARNLTRGVWL